MNSTKIGLVNFGGGTGKTTTCYWAARYFANKGISTLVIDTDAQGCVTAKLLGLSDEQCVDQVLGSATLANALEKNVPFNEIAKDTTIGEQVKVIGADKFLVDTMARLQTKSGNNLYLRRAIKREAELSAKVILVDSAPDADMMIENVLYAVDYVVIPATPEAKSVRGILTVMEMVENVRALRLESSDGTDNGPEIAGIVICDVGRNAGHANYVAKLKELGAQIAVMNGNPDDCYMTDPTGAPVSGILGIIPRYEGKKADTDLWLAYTPTSDKIMFATGV